MELQCVVQVPAKRRSSSVCGQLLQGFQNTRRHRPCIVHVPRRMSLVDGAFRGVRDRTVFYKQFNRESCVFPSQGRAVTNDSRCPIDVRQKTEKSDRLVCSKIGNLPRSLKFGFHPDSRSDNTLHSRTLSIDGIDGVRVLALLRRNSSEPLFHHGFRNSSKLYISQQKVLTRISPVHRNPNLLLLDGSRAPFGNIVAQERS